MPEAPHTAEKEEGTQVQPRSALSFLEVGSIYTLPYIPGTRGEKKEAAITKVYKERETTSIHDLRVIILVSL